MSYHLFCIYGKETIHFTRFFLEKQCSFSAKLSHYLYKVQNLCCLGCCSISLEQALNCICTQVIINVNVFIQKNIYPIQNYVQTSMGNCWLQDNVSFLCSAYDVAQLYLNLLEKFRLVLLIKDLLVRKHVNSNLNANQSKFFENKTMFCSDCIYV